MKSLFFALSLMSFVMYKSSRSDQDLMGTWKGSYRTIEKMMDVEIVFIQDNQVELYSNEFKSNVKAIGTYSISKSNDIAIICNWHMDSVSFSFNGKINPKRNFVNGDWKSGTNTLGSFYLAKAIL
jgi:hypothetical protein